MRRCGSKIYCSPTSTGELEISAKPPGKDEVPIGHYGYIGSRQEARDLHTVNILAFLVGMADITALMIHFSRPSKLRTLLELFKLDTANMEVRRMVTLLLRFVLRVTGPGVADAAWEQVMEGNQTSNSATHDNLLDMFLSRIMKSSSIVSSNMSQQHVAPDALEIHAAECIMLLRHLFNESMAWRRLFSDRFKQVAQDMMKDAKLNGKNSLEVESWLKVLGGECDCQRVGGRVVSKKSLKQRHRHLRDDKGPNNETVDHEGGESKSGGEEKIFRG